MVEISPSLLSADFSKLGEEVTALDKAGADRLHFDVMDGHFVPNITFGPKVIKDLRTYSKLPFETHLMISPVDSYIEAFATAGSDLILVHPESGPHLDRTLRLIKSFGKKAGIVLNPSTPLNVLDHVWDLIDQVLVMTVNPGFGGQNFIDSQVEKIQQLKKWIGGREIEIAVDGGITPQTAAIVVEAGAQVLIAGTSVFKTPDYVKNIKALKCT